MVYRKIGCNTDSPVQVKVTDALLEVSEETAAPVPSAAGTLIRKLEFIRKE